MLLHEDVDWKTNKAWRADKDCIVRRDNGTVLLFSLHKIIGPNRTNRSHQYKPTKHSQAEFAVASDPPLLQLVLSSLMPKNIKTCENPVLSKLMKCETREFTLPLLHDVMKSALATVKITVSWSCAMQARASSFVCCLWSPRVCTSSLLPVVVVMLLLPLLTLSLCLEKRVCSCFVQVPCQETIQNKIPTKTIFGCIAKSAAVCLKVLNHKTLPQGSRAKKVQDMFNITKTAARAHRSRSLFKFFVELFVEGYSFGCRLWFALKLMDIACTNSNQ